MLIPKFKSFLGDEEDFLVVYGDILTDQLLLPLVEMHKSHNAFATLLLHRRKISNSFIELDSENRIVNFLERPDKLLLEKLKRDNPEGFLVNSAVQILSMDVLEYIVENRCFDLPRDVYVPNCRIKKIYGEELTGTRVAIDSPERLAAAEKTKWGSSRKCVQT